MVLYVGKNEYGQQMILQQNGSKGQLSPMFKSDGGSYAQEKIYFVVIPKSGYDLYDQFAITNNTS